MLHNDEPLKGFGPKDRADNTRPLPTSLNRAVDWPWLCQGESVSIYYGRLRPTNIREHQHRRAECILTFAGARAEISSRSRTGEIEKQSIGGHQFCLIPPEVWHECEWVCEADIVVINIDEKLLLNHMGGPLRRVIVDDFKVLTQADAILWSIGGIFSLLCRKADVQNCRFIEGLGTALGARILERYLLGKQPGVVALPKLPNAALERVVDYINANMQDAISVADLATYASLSVGHFSRLVKNTTGWSPLQFLLKCRVERALNLLRTGKFRVGEVACEVGFYDQSHLNRHCRKFFGFAPKAAMNAALAEAGSS